MGFRFVLWISLELFVGKEIRRKIERSEMRIIVVVFFEVCRDLVIFGLFMYIWFFMCLKILCWIRILIRRCRRFVMYCFFFNLLEFVIFYKVWFVRCYIEVDRLLCCLFCCVLRECFIFVVYFCFVLIGWYGIRIVIVDIGLFIY